MQIVWPQQCEFSFNRWLITLKIFLNNKLVSLSIVGTSFVGTEVLNFLASRVEILISKVQIRIHT